LKTRNVSLEKVNDLNKQKVKNLESDLNKLKIENEKLKVKLTDQSNQITILKNKEKLLERPLSSSQTNPDTSADIKTI